MQTQKRQSPLFCKHNSDMIDMAKISQRWIVLITVILIMLWNTSVWFMAERYYLARANDLIEQETITSQQRASDLADSVRRNLNYLDGIPEIFTNLAHIKRAVSRFGADIAPSALPLEARIKQWTADPVLKDIDQYLAIVGERLNVDLIYVVNAAGDAIAASNWNDAGNTVGTNFAERDFFKQNKIGKRGMQFAVGKTTHIPGLFFSSPVIVDGKFMGVVVAKFNVPNLSFLINQLNAFVTDGNGVIIRAQHEEMEMHALPDAAISKLTEEERFARYRRKSFPMLKIDHWGDNEFPSLMRIENGIIPHILVTKALPEYGITVHVANELPTIPSWKTDRYWFASLLGAIGSLLILVAGGAVLYFLAITRSKTLLWKKANFDTLTNLPNRDLFRDRLVQEIKKSDRTSEPLALLLIDIDLFKQVNDTLGHDFGDRLLQEVARRIMDSVRKSDTVARLGGDEFAVVLPQISDAHDAEKIAQKVILKVAEPFHLGGTVTYVTASVGITLYPNDTTNIDNVMKNADQAMYAAKDTGRNRFSHFTISLQEAALERLHLTNDLRGALAANQFRVYFQPIVELPTGRVQKAEALLRWQHPVRGMVGPLEFITLAEETRFIIDIGKWVRKESAVWCKHWNDVRPDGFQISVNQSPIEFMDEREGDSLKSLLAPLHEHGLSGKNLVIEITEGLLLKEDPRITKKLMALRDAGIEVAIDDFGTGYSSLSYLKHFNIDYLKIDQSFIRNMESGSNGMVLCEAIIVMAHKLGLKVIAEGVETEQQRELLTRAGCDYAQGYLFSRPLPPEEIDEWLKGRS